jgi:single-strand DNA-binding protein
LSGDGKNACEKFACFDVEVDSIRLESWRAKRRKQKAIQPSDRSYARTQSRTFDWKPVMWNLITTPRGKTLVNITLAVTRHWTEEGQKREETTLSMCRSGAGRPKSHLGKGSPVFIEGRLQLDTWEEKESGQKRSRVRVVSENMQLLGSKEGARSPSLRAPAAAQNHVPKPSASPSPRAGVRVRDLDV